MDTDGTVSWLGEQRRSLSPASLIGTVLHLRRGVERRLQHRRRNRLPRRRPPRQVAEDRAAQKHTQATTSIRFSDQQDRRG
jgi:hypothetical protein